MARPIVLIPHLFQLAGVINFRKDYSTPSSPPSRPYNGGGHGGGRECGARDRGRLLRCGLAQGSVESPQMMSLKRQYLKYVRLK